MQSIRRSLVPVVVALVVSVFPAAAQAAPTDADTTFGTSGYTWFTSSSEIQSYQLAGYEVKRARPLSDGGFVSLDRDYSDVLENSYVRRLDAAGNPVATFGSGGTAVVDNISSGRSFVANDVAESGEGQLLVFGTKNATATHKPTVVKLDSAAGTIVAGYGTSGYYELPVPSGQTNLVAAQRCDLSGQGVCFVTSNGSGTAAVGKLAPDGAISGSVGTIDLSSLGYTKFYPEDIVADGARILISGSADDPSDGANALPVVVAITSSGLDASFGNGGVALLDGAEGDVHRIVATPAGGFAVLMSHTTLAKISPSGALDNAFGYLDCEPAPCYYDSLAVGTDGTIVTGGYKSAAPHTRISRFTASGQRDGTFGDAGDFGMSLGTGEALMGSDESADFVAVDALGRIVYRALGVKLFGYNGETRTRDASVFGRLVGTPPSGGGGGGAIPEPATVAFAKSLKSKLKAAKAKSIKGSAAGTALTKVEIAVQRVDLKLLKRSKKCAYLKSIKGTVKKTKAFKNKCLPSVWIQATGTTTWALKLKKKLAPGKYVFSARATGAAGVGAIVKKSVKITK
ncbi:MAG: hypothetical protein QM648_06420 [Solirubrobacterales bacterium]